MSLIKSLRRWGGKRLSMPGIANLVAQIEEFLTPGETIIDLGAGTCKMTSVMLQKGYSVTPVDIKNKSIYPSITPLLYDGRHLPFPDLRFDTALLVGMLHHTPDPVAVLREAARVARKLIIVEDIYTNSFEKYTSFIIDSLLNQEFLGHPHTNKTDTAWKTVFNKLGLVLRHTRYSRSWGYILNAQYYLLNGSRGKNQRQFPRPDI